MTYTKKDIVRKTATILEIPMSEADRWVDAVFIATREIILESEPESRLELRDFGSFEFKIAKQKEGARNPKTKESVTLPARRKMRFKPGKIIKGFLREPLPADILDQQTP